MTVLQRKTGKAWKRIQPGAVVRSVRTTGAYTRIRPGAGAPADASKRVKPTTQTDLFYAGYDDLARDVKTLATRLPAGCDGVVGLPNSGLLPAQLLAAEAGLPLYAIGDVPAGVKKLVVVEDATQFARFKQGYARLAAGREVVWTAVYACDEALQLLDAYAVNAPKPRVFAWNLHKYKNTRLFLFDIDGIVCADPTADECAEPAYSTFIRNAKPILPPLSVSGVITGAKPAMGTFVTGRKEAYRAATEAWLRQHTAGWQGLIMRADNAEPGSVAIARFKAGVYASSTAPLFVESSEKQAQLIHDATGKPVVCPQRGFGTRCGTVTTTSRVAGNRRTGNTKVIYTISTGEYGKVPPEVFDIPEGWDYCRITDADCPAYLSPKQRAAWAKINGPRLFSRYACSLCIDDDMSVLRDPTALFGDAEFAAIKRPQFETVADDFAAIVRARKAATAEDAAKEAARYAAAGLANAPMWLSGVVYRRHTDKIRRVCDEWLYWYTQSETRRDQPSMNTALLVHGVTPLSLVEKGNLLGYINHDIKKADRHGVRVRLAAA